MKKVKGFAKTSWHYVLATIILVIAVFISIFSVLEVDTKAAGLDGYYIELEESGMTEGTFTECIGIGSESEVIQHKRVDSGMNEYIETIPGRLSYKELVLKRPVTSDLYAWDWRKLIEEGDVSKKDIAIVLRDNTYEEIARWDLEEAWIVSITTEIDESGTMMEVLTIIYDDYARLN